MQLFSIENLEAFAEYLPEVIAQQFCVVVLKVDGEQLTIAHPDGERAFASKDDVEFLLRRPILWQPKPKHQILKAIQFAYGSVTPIKNCTWEFSFKCPQTWESFTQTENESVRHCSKCDKSVYLCFDESDVVRHAKLKNCVCVVNNVSGESIGDVVIADHD